MGDDTTPGQGLMEMIPPEACMDKPEAVDCAAVKAKAKAKVSSHYNRARPTFHLSLKTKIWFLS